MKDGDYFRVINEKSKYFNYYGKIIRSGPPGQAKCLVQNKNMDLSDDIGGMVNFDLSELIIANDEVETYKLLNS
jgi:hypothetical protein